MNWVKLSAVAIALCSASLPAVAQTNFDSVEFFRALRDGEASKAVELLRSRPTLLNARNDKGETSLFMSVVQRDQDWVNYLLSKGADPNIAARNGDTPLIAAARIGYLEAAEILISRKSKVNAANRMGETALIVAVQQRHLPMVKLLLRSGADPDRTDSAAGLSARDYAKRDARSREIIKAIEAAKKPAA